MWQLPSPQPPLEDGEVHLWSAHCLPTLDDLDALLQLLTPSEQERASRFATEALRRRYLQAHSLLHILLRAYIQTEQFELAYQINGKPFVRAPQAHSLIEFNMSHTGDYLLIGLARGNSVGVDVEMIRPLSDLESLIEACCTRKESKHIAHLPQDARLATFYQLWTRKEALLKMQGSGLSEKLSTVEVGEGLKGVTLIDLPSVRIAGDEYVGALALPELGKPTKVMHFSAQWGPGSA